MCVISSSIARGFVNYQLLSSLCPLFTVSQGALAPLTCVQTAITLHFQVINTYTNQRSNVQFRWPAV